MPDDNVTVIAPDAGQNPSEPAKDSKDAAFWKSKHDGLSGYVKQLEDQLKTLQQNHTETVTRMTGEQQSLAQEKTQFATEKQTLETQVKAFEAQVKQLESQVKLSERKETVRRTLSSPELIADQSLRDDLLRQYDGNLLPNLELLDDEGLKAWAQNKVAYETNKQADQRRHSKSGTLPTAPSTPAPTATTRTVSEIQAAIVKAAPGSPEREQLKAELIEAYKATSSAE